MLGKYSLDETLCVYQTFVFQVWKDLEIFFIIGTVIYLLISLAGKLKNVRSSVRNPSVLALLWAR